MRPFLSLGLALSVLLTPAPAATQDEVSSVATLHLADGTTVALVEWKLTYEFATWKQKEPVSSAKPTTRENPLLILGKKSYPVRGDSLTLTHVEDDDTVRVSTMSLQKIGALRVEQPAREVLAPELDKNVVYQPRSLDLSGKTLSGIQRSFCLSSFSALVACGGSKSTRIVKVDFN